MYTSLKRRQEGSAQVGRSVTCVKQSASVYCQHYTSLHSINSESLVDGDEVIEKREGKEKLAK